MFLLLFQERRNVQLLSENLCSSYFSVIRELGNAMTIHLGPSTHRTSVSGGMQHEKFQLKQLKPGKITNNQKQDFLMETVRQH